MVYMVYNDLYGVQWSTYGLQWSTWFTMVCMVYNDRHGLQWSTWFTMIYVVYNGLQCWLQITLISVTLKFISLSLSFSLSLVKLYVEYPVGRLTEQNTE